MRGRPLFQITRYFELKLQIYLRNAQNTTHIINPDSQK